MATFDSGREPDDDRGDNSHILTTAAGFAAILSLMVSITVLLLPHGGSTGHESPPSATAPAPRATARAWPQPRSLPAPAPPTSMVPLRPVREIGGDCSAGGVSAHWEMREGQWACVARNQRQIGADCSHEGITARWDRTPDGQWVCLAQEQGGSEPLPATPDGW
ncbi:hypothetical protein AB0B25_24580 [Nocardia sp. NPDC049190]|uniref:hypothetical protein n=1 Tax=Nocardia sp. NPDC049190 TaxID=3155650 RepID=UPI003403CBF6